MLINILKAYKVTKIERRLTDPELAHLVGNKSLVKAAYKNLQLS